MELKTLFEKEYINLLLETKGRACYDEDIILYILTKLTGKMCFKLDIPNIFKSYRNIQSTPTEEDLKSIKDFCESIISEYGLVFNTPCFSEVKGEDYYHPSRSGFSYNSSLKPRSYLLFGNEIICRVFYKDEFNIPFISSIIYTSDSEEIVKEIWVRYSEKCYEVVENHKDQAIELYNITTVVSQNGEYTPVVTSIYPTVSLISSDFMLNYNKDFPESRVKEFFDMDRGGIMIFNGTPGCGKSTYLKNLIFKHKDIDFVIIPQYLLLAQEIFRNFLFNMSSRGISKECVFIVEDCEQLLVQRENNTIQFSSIISDILNYTDGIYGDLTRTKFIFTFNADISNIDKAILRPGRLFLKYEFNPLIGENLEKLAEKLGYVLSPEEKKNGVPLAEIYSKTKTKDLIVESHPKKKIGFCSYLEDEEEDPMNTEGIGR